MSISVAIPTFNEEKNIEKCISAIYDWVDEIVIVDGTSTDKTVELAKKLDKDKKIKIFIRENPPNFLINKQKAIEKCTKDWILQLDADEVVTEELKSEILSLSQIKSSKLKIKNYNSKLKNTIAFWVPRLNYFLGKPLRKGGVYPDYVLRLYRNGVARIPLHGIHDQVEIITPEVFPLRSSTSGVEKDSKIGYLKNPLLHYPYPNFATYLRKWRQYCEYEAYDLKKKGVKPSLYLASCYLFLYPTKWFFLTYFRHLGLLDSLPGFVFSFMSAMRFWKIYMNLIIKNRS